MHIKRKIIEAISVLISNPRLFFKFLIAHLNYKILIRWLLPKSPCQKKINGVLFEFDFEFDPKIKEMYFGYYETETIEAIKRVLRPGDTFIDIGASIGYLSAIGAGSVGKNGQVHSFEPVPLYFQRLKKMAQMNPDYKIIINQCALGEKEEMASVDITSLENIGWNTMVPGAIKKEMLKETIEAPIYRLDNYIRQKALNNISLIKIDVEGFEFPVLRGLSNYFENIDRHPFIICEIIPYAYPLLGYTLMQLSEYMRKYNYNAYSLIDKNIKIDIAKLEDITLVMFR